MPSAVWRLKKFGWPGSGGGTSTWKVKLSTLKKQVSSQRFIQNMNNTILSKKYIHASLLSSWNIGIF